MQVAVDKFLFLPNLCTDLCFDKAKMLGFFGKEVQMSMVLFLSLSRLVHCP